MKSYFLLFQIFICSLVFGNDTLFTHPIYPPIVLSEADYYFYKYTPHYIPDNLLHCFSILATTNPENIERFKKKSKLKAKEEGFYGKDARIRKDFGLHTNSKFSTIFYRWHIYNAECMVSYILLCFHDYLSADKIKWHENKKLALENMKKWNKQEKHNLKHKFTNPIKTSPPPNKKVENDFHLYENDFFNE